MDSKLVTQPIITHLLQIRGPNDVRTRHLMPVFWNSAAGEAFVEVELLWDSNWFSQSFVNRKLQQHLNELRTVFPSSPWEFTLGCGGSEARPRQLLMSVASFSRFLDMHLQAPQTTRHPVLVALSDQLLRAQNSVGIPGLLRGMNLLPQAIGTNAHAST